MSDLRFNKVAGAVLATGLAIVGLRELSIGVFAPPEIEKAGYAVAVVEETAGGAAEAEAPIDWGAVLPTADIAAGEASFAKCVSCHTIAAGGPNGIGPNIYGVVGRKPAGVGGFAYSSGFTELAARQPVWDDPSLDAFLKAPQKYVAGTKMTFVGLKKPEERINMIAYLRAQGGNLPLPAPNPAAAAGVPAPSAPVDGAAPGAAAAGAPTATGSTATPAPVSGGPTGQGPGAPTEVQSKTASPN